MWGHRGLSAPCLGFLKSGLSCADLGGMTGGICSGCAAPVTANYCGNCGAPAAVRPSGASDWQGTSSPSTNSAPASTPPTGIPGGAPNAASARPVASAAPSLSIAGAGELPWAVTVMPKQAAPAAAEENPARGHWFATDMVSDVRRRWSGLQRSVKLGAAGAAGGVGALALLALTVSGGSPVARAVVSPKHSLTGTMTVDAFNDDSCGMAGWSASSRLDRLTALLDGQTYPCPNGPGGGYSDLADGAAVSVSDGSGNLLATGRLTGGTQKMSGVSWTFTLEDVPDADFYRVQVANRGELPYSRADLEAQGWTVSASLG